MPGPYIINCPHCNLPVELVHLPGKPTVEARKANRPPATDAPPEPVPDDNVSKIHEIIGLGNTDDE